MGTVKIDGTEFEKIVVDPKSVLGSSRGRRSYLISHGIFEQLLGRVELAAPLNQLNRHGEHPGHDESRDAVGEGFDEASAKVVARRSLTEWMVMADRVI